MGKGVPVRWVKVGKIARAPCPPSADVRASCPLCGSKSNERPPMDMNVSVHPASTRVADKADDSRSARAPNSSDLDAWLEKVAALGELKRITAEVDPDLEAATITYLVGGEKSPALLFENIKGHPGHRALYNMVGCNLSRFCLMIGEQPMDHPLKAVQSLQQKLGRKVPPKQVSPEQAIC